jgi:hypothetical protein
MRRGFLVLQLVKPVIIAIRHVRPAVETLGRGVQPAEIIHLQPGATLYAAGQGGRRQNRFSLAVRNKTHDRDAPVFLDVKITTSSLVFRFHGDLIQ